MSASKQQFTATRQRMQDDDDMLSYLYSQNNYEFRNLQ